MSDSKDELRLGDCGIYTTQDEIEDTRLEWEEIMRNETEFIRIMNDKNLQGKVQVEAFNVKPHIELENVFIVILHFYSSYQKYIIIGMLLIQ